MVPVRLLHWPEKSLPLIILKKNAKYMGKISGPLLDED
jgi:hypothetical protein